MNRPRPLVSILVPVLALAAAAPSRALTAYTFVRNDYVLPANQAIGIAGGDFDEDGKTDIIVSSLDDQAVLLTNTGSGFSVGSPIALGPIVPFWNSAVDFNGDGHLDAVIAGVGVNFLSLLAGDGNGNFAQIQIPVGNGPIHVAMADFDKDGKPDLVAANSGSPFITIRFGSGARLDIPVPIESHTTAIRDFNEDGVLDIAVSFSDINEEVGLLIGNGAGGFLPFASLGLGFGYHLAAGDFDGDGHVDLVTAPLGLSNVWMFLGNGNGTFDITAIDNVGPGWNDCQVVDLDCDGLDDAIVIGADSVLYSGDRTAGLIRNTTLDTQPDPASLAHEDYDGDGVIDLAFPELDSPAGVDVLTNTTVFLWCPPDFTVDPAPTCLVDFGPSTCDTTLVITSVPALPAQLPLGPTTVVFTAVDPAGQTATCSTTVTVIDKTPPILIGVPPDTTAECDDIPPPATPTAIDCDPNVTITLVETRIDGPCPDDYTLVRTWTATDSSGNSASASQNIEVSDTKPPVVIGCALRPAAAPGPTSSSASFGGFPLLPLAPPRAPLAARSAKSACSASSAFVVDCGTASDNCDPAPQLQARVVLTHHEVNAGACIEKTDEVDVACGEIVELVRLSPPCPVQPAPPRPPVLVRSNGTRVLQGEKIRLEVTAVDRCGNVSDPCVDDVTDRLCAPQPAKCPTSLCGN